MVNVFLIMLCVLVALFLLSLVIYFFNLDMKIMVKMMPFLSKHYDRIKRDRHL